MRNQDSSKPIIYMRKKIFSTGALLSNIKDNLRGQEEKSEESNWNIIEKKQMYT